MLKKVYFIQLNDYEKPIFFFFAKQLLYREVFSIISFTTGIKKNDYAHETFL